MVEEKERRRGVCVAWHAVWSREPGRVLIYVWESGLMVGANKKKKRGRSEKKGGDFTVIRL